MVAGTKQERWKEVDGCKILKRQGDKDALHLGSKERRRQEGLRLQDVGLSEVPVTDTRSNGRGTGILGPVQFQAPLIVPSGSVKLSS